MVSDARRALQSPASSISKTAILEVYLYNNNYDNICMIVYTSRYEFRVCVIKLNTFKTIL